MSRVYRVFIMGKAIPSANKAEGIILYMLRLAAAFMALTYS